MIIIVIFHNMSLRLHRHEAWELLRYPDRFADCEIVAQTSQLITSIATDTAAFQRDLEVFRPHRNNIRGQSTIDP